METINVLNTEGMEAINVSNMEIGRNGNNRFIKYAVTLARGLNHLWIKLKGTADAVSNDISMAHLPQWVTFKLHIQRNQKRYFVLLTERDIGY